MFGSLKLIGFKRLLIAKEFIRALSASLFVELHTPQSFNSSLCS